MFSLIIFALKASIVGLWGLALLGLLSMSPIPIKFQFYVLPLIGIVLVIHLVEYFAIKAKIMAKAKIEMSFIQTMLWGFGYWLPLLNKK